MLAARVAYCAFSWSALQKGDRIVGDLPTVLCAVKEEVRRCAVHVPSLQSMGRGAIGAACEGEGRRGFCM